MSFHPTAYRLLCLLIAVVAAGYLVMNPSLPYVCLSEVAETAVTIPFLLGDMLLFHQTWSILASSGFSTVVHKLSRPGQHFTGK